MQPFAGRATLVSPAITNGAPPMGTGWMDSFLSECSKLGCRVDAIAAHIYDSASNIADYKQYITDLGTRYNKPVLITEFGATGSVPEQQAFLKEIIPLLLPVSVCRSLFVDIYEWRDTMTRNAHTDKRPFPSITTISILFERHPH